MSRNFHFMAGCALALGLLLPAAASADEVKLGIVAPLTGPLADFGIKVRNGVDQAVADINATGGILGNKIAVTYGDDRADPKEGVSVANRQIGEGVKFVVGGIQSSVAIATSKEFAEGGVLLISPSATNPRVTDEGDWNVFRTCGRDEQQGQVAGHYIVDHFKGKTVAIVHDRTPYGKGLADETKRVANAGGVREVFYDGINPNEKDYSALVTRLKQLNTDYIYFGGSYPEAGLIVRQMRDQGMHTVMLGGDGLVTDEFGTIAGPGAAGTLMTFSHDPRNNPEAAKVVAAFRAKNIEPEGFLLYSYAAVQVIAQAAEAAKSTDPKKVAETIRSGIPFDTVIGKISYDNKGDIKQPGYVIYEWKLSPDGKLSYGEKKLDS